ncbi:MAG: PH domain-containing protein [Synergistaceae bacterium]|nr:PH domain-containing protein [Synergistaceae bacterium]
MYETGRHPVTLLFFSVMAFALAIPTYGMSIVLVIPPLIQMKTARYMVTNRRVLARLGFFRPRLLSVKLEDVVEASLGKGPLDAKFGSGMIVLAKMRAMYRFKGVRNSEAFLSHVKQARAVRVP